MTRAPITAGKGADGGVIFLHRRIVALAGAADAVLGAGQVDLQRLEIALRGQLGIGLLEALERDVDAALRLGQPGHRLRVGQLVAGHRDPVGVRPRLVTCVSTSRSCRAKPFTVPPDCRSRSLRRCSSGLHVAQRALAFSSAVGMEFTRRR
jgi:hypothetical protein